ncbi:MAG: vWA domain-containing protein, partial [Gammaproteobacteria bacterium]
MIQFEWIWLLAALPLPLIYRWLLPPRIKNDEAALLVPALDDFGPLVESRSITAAKRWPYFVALLAWILFVIACTRPQWLGEPVEVPISGRDLMLAVDLSKSMLETDFVINNQSIDRLTATKKVAGDFIEQRVGDRIGLILFGTQAYLHVPLTFDRKTVTQLLDESVIGLAGPSTAIGDAIGIAVKRLRENDAEDKVLILLTDGANTAGSIDPIRAAELAADNGLKIHTIGIGADEMMVRRLFSTFKVNPSRDLDEETLTTIAESTGGKYFRARDTEELAKIYAEIDRLEPVERGGEHFRPVTSLYIWPLSAACVLAIICFWANSTGRRG